jgi:hypothetical protein
VEKSWKKMLQLTLQKTGCEGIIRMHLVQGSSVKETNFLDIIYYHGVIKNTTFGDWSLSPSSGETYSVGPS